MLKLTLCVDLNFIEYPEYHALINTEKTLVNFDAELNGVPIKKLEDGAGKCMAPLDSDVFHFSFMLYN